ncbi:MAG: hypothetical protein LAT67_13110 [Balneolales bacterium]|nr:hypothetical protein [Balneolales bacterium]
MDKPVNYTKEAFLHPMNLAILIAAFSSSFFLAGQEQVVNIILSLTVASELLYLGIVPRLPRFQKYINLKSFKERNSRFDERRIFGELNESSQKRFLVLKHIAGLIRGNFTKTHYASHGILDNINTRIESLLTSYMLLLEGNERYEQYLNNTTLNKLQQDFETTGKEIEEADSDRLKTVMGRRLHILDKRMEKYKLAREKYLISDSQLKTIEDTLRYIYEKSMTMSNLDEIEHQMDSLMMDLDDSEMVFNEMNYDRSVSTDYMTDLQRLERDMEETDKIFRESQKTKARSES